MSWTGTGQQAFSRSFGYDPLNRLSTMQETNGGTEGCKPASSPSNPYTLSWTIDAWGNRTSQTPNAGTCSFSQPVDANNRFLAPYQYDSAGNMTNDGNHTYFYDAENRIIQVDGGSTASYVYDANGLRIRKSSGGSTTDYLYDLSGNIFSEFIPGCTAGCWVAGALYLNGQFFAEYYNNTTYFVHSDHLGSSRLLTALDQSLCDNLDYLPFGEQIAGGSCTNLKFTGKERDSESGLDNFIARYNSSSLGRFMSPDPENAGASENDPQFWNGYAYVGNDPLNSVDPSGLVTCKVDGVEYDCGHALHSVQLGTAAVCPNNSCTTWRFTTNMSGQDVFQNTAPFGTVWHPYPPEDSFTSSGNSVSGIFTFQGARPIDQSWSIAGMRMLGIASNFSAGAGDALTLGLTKPARKAASWIAGMGYGENVNYRSGAYWTGVGTGTAVGIGLSGPEGPIFGGPKFQAFGYEGYGLLNRAKFLRVGWSWVREGQFYRFRIGGNLIKLLRSSGHINLWPPSAWFW